MRILILSVSAGAGHLRAAEAVEAACRIRHPAAEIRNVDVLELTSAPFRRLYGKGYLDLVGRAPALLGFFYDRTNRPPKSPGLDALRLAVEKLNTKPFLDFVRDFAPDVVCHTHFLPAELLDAEKARGRFDTPHAVVVTDFEVHRFWLCPSAALTFVPREENRVHLQALGVPRERIRVTGIPVHPLFAETADPAALRRKHGVREGLPLLLVLAGGFGVGPVERLVRALWREVPRAQVVVAAGRNAALRARLAGPARRAPLPTRVLGFSTEIHEWMSLASLVLTKPGGLTTSEALARGLPIVIVSPIPGQETRNASMLLEAGAGMSGENLYTVGWRVARLLKSPVRMEAMRLAARHLGRPRAAFEVAEALGSFRIPG